MKSVYPRFITGVVDLHVYKYRNSLGFQLIDLMRLHVTTMSTEHAVTCIDKVVNVHASTQNADV